MIFYFWVNVKRKSENDFKFFWVGKIRQIFVFSFIVFFKKILSRVDTDFFKKERDIESKRNQKNKKFQTIFIYLYFKYLIEQQRVLIRIFFSNQFFFSKKRIQSKSRLYQIEKKVRKE